MTTPSPCQVRDCAQSAVVQIENLDLCVSHFIANGYERIDRYSHAVTQHEFHQVAPDSVWRFIAECIARTADLTQHAEQLDNLERARLLDILLRCADLSRHLRRSPRRRGAISVRLQSEKLGHAWEEETQTKVLSRYGAMLECNHESEPGDRLGLVRLDTLEPVQARVAWCREGSSGRFEIGIEFLSCDNFWNIDWEATEERVSPAGWLPEAR